MQPRAVGRAISPVVGTVFLLGIVVVLGAFAFGAVAFGVSDHLVQPTHANLQAEETPERGIGSVVTVTHSGGETINTDAVTVRAMEADTSKPLSAFTAEETLTAGDRVTIHASEVGAAPDGDRIVVQWQRSGSSTVLASATVSGGSTASTPLPTPSPTPTATPTPPPTPTPSPEPPTGTPECNDDDHDHGHGNDCDGDDEDNPGRAPALPPGSGDGDGDGSKDDCDGEDSETPTATATPGDDTDGCCSEDDDHDRGHGNDCDHDDEDNPGRGPDHGPGGSP
jgi:flagellin-like protein